MGKNNKFEFYIPVTLSIFMLLAIKIPYINLPFCYSEAELLTDSIYYLNFNGLSTVFSGDSVELPDLFSVLISYFVKYVSADTIYLHSLTMVFSILTIYIAYKFGKFFFSIQAGVMSAAIIAVQNVFISQSGLVLPYMMLNLLILSGVFAYFREKFGLSALLICLAVLTDITGLFTAIFVSIHYYVTSRSRDWKMRKNVALCLPILIWFLYEIASVMICSKLTIRNFDFSIMNFVDNLNFIFIQQFRFVLLIMFAATLIITKFSNENQYYAHDIFKGASILFAILFVVISCFSNTESYNLSLITFFGIAVGCGISILNISYYQKYIICCLLMICFAFNAIFDKKNSDAYLSYKDKIEVDIKTIENIKPVLKKDNIILCDKYYDKFFKYSKLGYVDINFNCVENYKIMTKLTDSTDIFDFGIISNLKDSKSILTPEKSSAYKCISKISKNNYETQLLKKK